MVLKIICSLLRIQALFNNGIVLYRGLEAFYITLGHVNPIGNYNNNNYYYGLEYNCTIGSDGWPSNSCTTIIASHFLNVNTTN